MLCTFSIVANVLLLLLLLLRHITFYTFPFGFLWRDDVQNDTILFVLSFFFLKKKKDKMLEVCSDQIVSSRQYACMNGERVSQIKSTMCVESKYMWNNLNEWPISSLCFLSFFFCFSFLLFPIPPHSPPPHAIIENPGIYFQFYSFTQFYARFVTDRLPEKKMNSKVRKKIIVIVVIIIIRSSKKETKATKRPNNTNKTIAHIVLEEAKAK